MSKLTEENQNLQNEADLFGALRGTPCNICLAKAFFALCFLFFAPEATVAADILATAAWTTRMNVPAGTMPTPATLVVEGRLGREDEYDGDGVTYSEEQNRWSHL